MKFLLNLFAICFLILVPNQVAFSRQIAVKPTPTCQSMAPYGNPTVRIPVITICRTAYLIGYDQKAKIPNWVSYSLDARHALGCFPRSDSFYVDETLTENARSEPRDYAKTGYDIGHMANASDMAYTQDAETESFLMSNMTPQKPNVNRGVWKSIETAVRTWAVSRNSRLIIVSGSVYSARSKTIGNKVVVPDSIYKVIIDPNTNTYMAFIVPQVKTPDSLEATQTTISQIEATANVVIGVPAGLVKSRKDPLWDIELSAYNTQKRNSCSK